MIISNKYKSTLDNLINSSNSKFLLRSIDKKSYNMPKIRGYLISFLEENSLDKDVLTSNKLSQLVSKTANFQLYQHYDIKPFGLKNKKA